MTYSAWAGAHQGERHFQVALAAAQLPAQQHELLTRHEVQVLKGDADGQVAGRGVGVELP